MYPLLTKENKIAGLEIIDFLLLAAVYLVVFLFSKNLFVNLGIVLVAYFFLRVYKHHKPPRYTQTLLRFFMLPGYYTQDREMEV